MKLLVAALFAACASVALGCCDTCTCWEKCFDNPTDQNDRDWYPHLHRIVQSVRGHRLSHNIQGTTYVLDSSVNSPSQWGYEKDLTRLLILTEPAGQTCNPLFLARYRTALSGTFSVGWTTSSWYCRETCSASQLLNTWTASTVGSNPTTDWAWGAGWLGNMMSDNCNPQPFDIQSTCKKDAGNRRMLVAMINSGIPWSNPAGLVFQQNNAYDVRMSVEIDTSNPVNNWPKNLAYATRQQTTEKAWPSLQRLNRCIETSCCRYGEYDGNDRADDGTDGPASVSGAIVDAKGNELKTFQDISQEEFDAIVAQYEKEDENEPEEDTAAGAGKA